MKGIYQTHKNKPQAFFNLVYLRIAVEITFLAISRAPWKLKNILDKTLFKIFSLAFPIRKSLICCELKIAVFCYFVIVRSRKDR